MYINSDYVFKHSLFLARVAHNEARESRDQAVRESYDPWDPRSV